MYRVIRSAAAVLLTLLLLTGCSLLPASPEQYQVTWTDVFDTVVTLKGYAASPEDFRSAAERAHTALLKYHRLFDIYHTYEGIHNLKTINDSAGGSPVTADAAILDLLADCRRFCEMTGGKVNPAAGAMLTLWHEAREAGLADPEHAALPDPAALEEAAAHCSFDTVILDREAGTVCITDPGQQLDVGAIAKGWAGQKVRALLPEGYLLNLGGNICAAGSKPHNEPWRVGIQDPDGKGTLLSIPISDSNTVTSGDYQRFYTVDGVRFHHIIDPDTRMPGRIWRAVTIVCPDSGLADCLSTALFLLPQEEGARLAAQCGAEALWIDASGNLRHTENFPMK